MSAPDISRDIMRHFGPLADDAHLTILLGAGASAPSGLPSWDELATRLAMASKVVTSEKAAAVLLDKQDPSLLLEAARVRSGDKWNSYLEEALYPTPQAGMRPSPLHLAVADHRRRRPQHTTLATLNFDSLLEDAVLEAGDVVVAVDTNGEKALDGTPIVHHLHGIVFREGFSEAPVVGYLDYANLVAQPDAWQFHFLEDALKRGPLLLAGTTYRDPDIRHWLHRILQRKNAKHSALVTIVRQGLGLDRETFSMTEEALIEEWRAIGLDALTLHDYSDIALILRELEHISHADYQSPQERAISVWNAHREKFHAHQPSYSDLLAEHAQKLGKVIGVRPMRSTLWLANGSGELIRWASADTIYRNFESLKHIPTGHDSQWIAGKALASEEVELEQAQPSESKARPSWQSVLAIPILLDDGVHPAFASAVVSFAIPRTLANLVRKEDDWNVAVKQISFTWKSTLNSAAFSQK